MYTMHPAARLPSPPSRNARPDACNILIFEARAPGGVSCMLHAHSPLPLLPLTLPPNRNRFILSGRHALLLLAWLLIYVCLFPLCRCCRCRRTSQLPASSPCANSYTYCAPAAAPAAPPTPTDTPGTPCHSCRFNAHSQGTVGYCAPAAPAPAPPAPGTSPRSRISAMYSSSSSSSAS